MMIIYSHVAQNENSSATISVSTHSFIHSFSYYSIIRVNIHLNLSEWWRQRDRLTWFNLRGSQLHNALSETELLWPRHWFKMLIEKPTNSP